MADDKKTETKEAKPAEEMVMCYISKQMVPISETVEVQYSATKKQRVLPQFIKY